MSRQLEQSILESRHYVCGETFKANDIQTLLRGRGKILTISTIKKSLSKLRDKGFVTILPKATHDESNVYMKSTAQIFADGKPLMSRPWRSGEVEAAHSPRYF